jgi:hypothetical protein
VGGEEFSSAYDRKMALSAEEAYRRSQKGYNPSGGFAAEHNFELTYDRMMRAIEGAVEQGMRSLTFTVPSIVLDGTSTDASELAKKLERELLLLRYNVHRKDNRIYIDWDRTLGEHEHALREKAREEAKKRKSKEPPKVSSFAAMRKDGIERDHVESYADLAKERIDFTRPPSVNLPKPNVVPWPLEPPKKPAAGRGRGKRGVNALPPPHLRGRGARISAISPMRGRTTQAAATAEAVRRISKPLPRKKKRGKRALPDDESEGGVSLDL